MSLTSASTITDALDQYKNNLNWEGSVSTAQNALEAVRFILATRPKVIAAGDQINVNFESLQQEKEKLEGFVGKLGSTVNRCSFTRGRMLT